ncbi:MAG TPA: energy transducer TonB, partial [Thermoanaerobaculia bacterium]|nr:energy transducer TonB [Thermoanaerobaculia bacterium]
MLLLTLATVLAAGPAAQGQRDYLADWRQRMAEVEDNLRLGHWEPAGESADRLLQEMLPRVRNEGDGPALIATVLYLGAASAAGAGEEESALWRWWLAQNLDPQLRRLPLPDLGAASALLDRHRLRAEDAIPQGLPTLPAEWEPTGYRPPLPLRVPYPSGDTSRWSADVGVEFLIDADGSVSQPVLVASGDATLVQVYLQFMALREWRYRPATYRGEPVAVAFTVQSLRTPLSPLDNWVRMDLLREPHDLLADEAWEEAAAQAWDLTRKAGSNFVLIGALSFAAVAEAQLGNRQRALGALRTVESLGGSAYPQLPAYGDGALWLWQQRARCIRAFRWSDIDGEGEPLDEVCTSDPRTDGGFEPPRPLETPWADLAEAVTDEPVFVRLLVDDQGWVSEARMLASGTAETAPTVLAAVQEWRFEAAQRNGEAVPTFYDTVLSPPPVGNGEAVEEWQRRLGAVEKQVSAAEWAVALEAANRLQGDLEADLVRGGAELLGRTLAARALAEAGLATAGDADQRFAADALWHWHAAQSLAPQVGYLDLSRHGAAGALLAPHTPPRPLGAEPYLVSASHEPPRVIERVAPAVGAAGGGLVEIEVSIDAAGRPHTPVWHSGGPSAHLSAAFEALRNWRFEPPAEGAPERRRVV